MKKFSLILAFLCSSLTFVSCSGSSGGDGEQQREEDGGNTGGFTYDSELSGEERQSLEESTQKLATLVIDGRRIKGFSQVFGGNSSSDVVRYLETRINYFISESTDIDSRLVPASLAAHNFGVYGSNPSVFIWYEAKNFEPGDLRFQINGKQVEIVSSRIGVMQLGDIFNQSDTITQAITIVHEGRHSDCTGGALASDIESYATNQPIEKNECGQLHGICPAGHPNAGGSCDVVPWGAYAVDFIYSLSIAEACSSCSETEKQQGLVNAFNVSESTTYNFVDTVNGAFGPADMSSSNQVK